MGGLFRLINSYIQYDISSFSLLFCKIRAYIVIVGYILSRHFLCLISIDRWMITSKNVFIRRQCTPRKAHLLILISIIFWFGIEVFIPIGFYVDRNTCRPSVDALFLFMYQMIDLIFTLTSFIILIIFSLFTLNNVSRKRIFPNNTHTLTVMPSIGMTNDRNAVETVHGTTGENNTQHQKFTKKEFHLIRLCLIQAFVYILFNIPGASYNLYAYITRLNTKPIDQLAIDLLLNTIGSNLAYTHCAATFYIYTLTSKEFRKQFSVSCQSTQRRFISLFQ